MFRCPAKKSLKVFLPLIGLFTGVSTFASVNSQYSLELMVEPSVEAKVNQLVSMRLAPNHGFSKEELAAIVRDLSVLASLKGGPSSPLYYEIYLYQKEFDGAKLLSWLLGGIKQFRASKGASCSDFNEMGFNACALLSTQTILFSPLHFQNDRMKRILTMIHERRHFDGYDHIPKTLSFDKEIKGTRGAQLSFIVSLVNSCSNCTIIAKRNALAYKDEIIGAITNLSSQDRSLLNTELASLQSPMSAAITNFLAELKQQGSFLASNHMECKSGMPLYLYQQQRIAMPNVDAQDCFNIYYNSDKSPNLGDQFPEGVFTRFGALFILVPRS